MYLSLNKGTKKCVRQKSRIQYIWVSSILHYSLTKKDGIFLINICNITERGFSCKKDIPLLYFRSPCPFLISFFRNIFYIAQIKTPISNIRSA
ncbi:hypothetical protein C436_05430 [Haloarcula marismortui ATCC 33800]|uniref:Uncharacterized protein n=1 Tax=Haloarcula marismortui ATCC 33800 TaxID=662476 RepID=M0K1V8_9EURY|nr:hypothetical protein C436_05430 [Haloarcula sinaiiensis ATCC 33800]